MPILMQKLKAIHKYHDITNYIDINGLTIHLVIGISSLNINSHYVNPPGYRDDHALFFVVQHSLKLLRSDGDGESLSLLLLLSLILIILGKNTCSTFLHNFSSSPLALNSSSSPSLSSKTESCVKIQSFLWKSQLFYGPTCSALKQPW